VPDCEVIAISPITLIHMVPARQRVSYVIPPPADPVPRLQLPPYGLPRLGLNKPLLIPLDVLGDSQPKANAIQTHPRHRLGVASLALDTCTQLAGRSTPEGILYTGGRDGMVISWDLGIRMKKRSGGAIKTQKGRWEMITGWGNDVIDEENEEDVDDGLTNFGSDGDVLGDVTEAVKKRKGLSASDPLLHEQLWEIDTDSLESGKVS
jgi:WD repeat-containing protein 48